jgi:hypothetical protein
MEVCQQITKDLMGREIFNIFRRPVDPVADGVPDYPQRISKPMDLGTISDRLNRHKYRNSREWYSDLELVFQNGIDYHGPGTIWHPIAVYGLAEVQRMAVGLDFSSEQEWFDAVSKVSVKLSKIISAPPAQRVSNPIQSVSRAKAESLPPPNSDALEELVKRLNGIVADETVRNDVCAILKECQGMDIETAAKEPIEVEKLKPLTLNMLILYIDSRGK